MTDKYCIDCKHSEVVNSSENAPFLGVWRLEQFRCGKDAKYLEKK